MLQEIHQQPEILDRTLRGEIRPVERFKRLVANRRPKLIVLCARGTSDNAAQFGRYLIEITTGISAPPMGKVIKMPKTMAQPKKI